jgi:molecular chaperone GrpE
MMADKTAPEPDNPAENAAAEDSDGVQAPQPAAEVEALRAEVADLKEKLLRTLAEMENLRRRTEREIADGRQYAVANFARDMLTVSDNLRRALDAVPKDAGKDDPALAALIEGVEVTERGLQQSLTKNGVKRIDTKGQKFDPSFHQAMFEMETDEVPPGSVAQEVQAGYVIGERVLRPALVGVARRPAKAEAPANDA